VDSGNFAVPVGGGSSRRVDSGSFAVAEGGLSDQSSSLSGSAQDMCRLHEAAAGFGGLLEDLAGVGFELAAGRRPNRAEAVGPEDDPPQQQRTDVQQ
jgi:hypothetical protein